jgi:hypothetical protein
VGTDDDTEGQVPVAQPGLPDAGEAGQGGGTTAGTAPAQPPLPPPRIYRRRLANLRNVRCALADALRDLEARLRRVEGGQRGQPEAWVDRYLRAHPESGLPHAVREQLRGIVATGAERDWFHRPTLARSSAPVHEPSWLLELSTAAIQRLGALWRAGGPDPAREAWRVVVEHVQAILPMLNEYLATEGRHPFRPEQEDHDLARYWNLATGEWPVSGLGVAVRAFVAGGPVPPRSPWRSEPRMSGVVRSSERASVAPGERAKAWSTVSFRPTADQP